MSADTFHEVDVVQSLSCVQLCDPMDCSMPDFLVLHCLPELAQIHVHWVNDAIQSSHPLSPAFSSCPQSFPASGYFPMSQLFTSGGQSTAASALAFVLPMNIQGWFHLFWLVCSLDLSRVFSSNTVWKDQFFTSGGQSTAASALASVLPMNIQDWFLLGLTGLILSKGLKSLQHHSSKASILQHSVFFYGSTLTSRHAAAVKLRQSCRTLYDPTDGSPPGSAIPGSLQARILE